MTDAVPTAGFVLGQIRRPGSSPWPDSHLSVDCVQCKETINLASAVITEKEVSRLYACPVCANMLVSIHAPNPESADREAPRKFGNWILDLSGDINVMGFGGGPLLKALPIDGCGG